MNFPWKKQKNMTLNQNGHLDKTENHQKVRQNISEKSLAFNEQKFTHWMEEAIKEHEEKGGFDDLPGKGKPIKREYLKGDVFNGILKHNRVLPPWLEMQHQIRDAIHDLLAQMEQDHIDIQHEISAINEKILLYNNKVPSPVLQKSTLSVDNIAESYKEWN